MFFSYSKLRGWRLIRLCEMVLFETRNRRCGAVETMVMERAKIEEIAALLRDGKLVAFPTDTVYGLACVYDNEEAILRMKEAKGRSELKPFPMMVRNVDQAKRVAVCDERSTKIMEKWMPGALTLVMNKLESVPGYVTNGSKTVAIRIPDDSFVLSLLELVGKPLLVTSANLSDHLPGHDDKEVLAQLEGRIDAIVRGEAHGVRPSTIIDVTQDEMRVLREGPISIDRIQYSLRGE